MSMIKAAAFLLCSGVKEDSLTHHWRTVVDVIWDIPSKKFPLNVRMCLYYVLLGEGDYVLSLEVKEVTRRNSSRPIFSREIQTVSLLADGGHFDGVFSLPLSFPRPGLYSFRLLVPGIVLAEQILPVDISDEEPNQRHV